MDESAYKQTPTVDTAVPEFTIAKSARTVVQLKFVTIIVVVTFLPAEMLSCDDGTLGERVLVKPSMFTIAVYIVAPEVEDPSRYTSKPGMLLLPSLYSRTFGDAQEL